MNWGLPNSVEVQGVTYSIRTDFRVILDILTDLSDPDADGKDRSLAVLIGLYPLFDDMPPEHYQDAVQAGLRFINYNSDEEPQKAPKLVDWEQDYTLIVAPINRTLGYDIRALEYMHWWTFLAAFGEIGDCTFAQVVRIRDRLSRHKTLDKTDKEFYRKNRKLVDFQKKYTEADDELVKQWT